MHSANRFPVMLYFEGGHVGYAEGGLHDEAMAVKKAGRNGDSHLVHMNDEEFAQFKAEYGEPTINPETGMPEFFLGGIGKFLKKIAPFAAFAIPFVGPALGTALGVSAPIASAGLGAGLGALGGGGIKGALLGGALGGLGAGGAQGVGAKVGTGILGQAANPRLAQAFGSALLGGAASAALGGNPLMGALSVGLGNYMRNPMAAGVAGPVPPPVDVAASGPTTLPGAATELPAVSVKNPVPSFGGTTASSTLNPSSFAPSLSVTPSVSALPTAASTMPVGSISRAAFESAAAAPSMVNSSFQASPALQAALDKAAAAAPAAPNFWNKDFLGLGIAKNKYAIPAVIGAAALADAAKPKTDTSMPSQEAFFGPSFSQSGLNAPGNFKLASVSSGTAPESAAAEYAKKYFRFAAGGDVGGEGHSSRSSFAVEGPGTGRSDEIPAMLSDGEYVMDAETVSMLGDGSPKAGAKKLDDLRVKIRKHKGKKLAKGKFSPNAKPAEKYMAGGRI